MVSLARPREHHWLHFDCHVHLPQQGVAGSSHETNYVHLHRRCWTQLGLLRGLPRMRLESPKSVHEYGVRGVDCPGAVAGSRNSVSVSELLELLLPVLDSASQFDAFN